MAEMKWNHNIKIQETHSTQKDPENCEKWVMTRRDLFTYMFHPNVGSENLVFQVLQKKKNSMKEKRTKIFDSRENWKWKTQIESDSFFFQIFSRNVYTIITCYAFHLKI
jgi:hypothetical protein